ncbi:MAG: LytTR family DNA-binding domain-containing protein [Bacteroidales bacterium]|nr:LytTR family DNA-binding domain-containing protein [Bacteroidales bacterium]
MAIRCIIVDDEFPARILLKEFIEKVPNLELIGSFESGLAALEVIQKGDVDLMFLDIQMPDITGVNFVKMLTKKPLVVFTTAYSEYAIESYQLDVLDYLLKPFSFDRFMQAVGKAMARMQPQTQTPEVETNAAANDCIMVKADHKIFRVRFDSILYVEGLREYVTIYCTNGEKFVTLDSLRNLEESFPESMFVRIHKSYIVRRDAIKSLYGNQIMLDGTKGYLPVGKSYLDMMKKFFTITTK